MVYIFLSTLLDLYKTMFYVNFHCNEMLSLFCWFFSQHLWKLMVEESDLLGQLKVIASLSCSLLNDAGEQ